MFDKISEDGEGWIVVGFIPTNCGITLEQDQYKVMLKSIHTSSEVSSKFAIVV